MGLFSKKHKEPASSADKKKDEGKKGVAEVKVEKEDKEVGVIKGGVKKKSHSEFAGIITRPLMTEKATFLGAENQYVFEVSTSTGKGEIKKAIEAIYNVKPIKVNILKVLGKKMKSGRHEGKGKNWKKAIVTLKAGEKIEIYKGV